jgi:hypothetical protein
MSSPLAAAMHFLIQFDQLKAGLYPDFQWWLVCGFLILDVIFFVSTFSLYSLDADEEI